jgi:hypothetical protein
MKILRILGQVALICFNVGVALLFLSATSDSPSKQEHLRSLPVSISMGIISIFFLVLLYSILKVKYPQRLPGTDTQMNRIVMVWLGYAFLSGIFLFIYTVWKFAVG